MSTRLVYLLLAALLALPIGCRKKETADKTAAPRTAEKEDPTDGKSPVDEPQGGTPAAADAAPPSATPQEQAEEVKTSGTEAIAEADRAEEPPPRDDKAVAVVTRAIQMAGGEGTLRRNLSASSVKTRGTYFGSPYEMVTHWLAPDKMVMVMPADGLTMGYAGPECWNRFHDIVKNCMKEEQQSAPETLWSYHVLTLYPLADESFGLEYLGGTEVNGRAAEEVRVTHAGAPMPMDLAFDADSGLLVRTRYEGHFSGKQGPVEMVVTKHIKEAGMTGPGMTEMRMGEALLIKDEFVSATYGKVDPEIFQRPTQATFREPKVRLVPERTVARARHAGDYRKMGMTIGRLYGWIGQQGLTPLGPATMLYLKDPKQTENPDEYVTDLLVPVAPPAPGTELPAGFAAIEKIPAQTIVVQVDQGPYDKVSEGYAGLAAWAKEQGLEIAGPAAMTDYDNPMFTPPDKLLHELYFPVTFQEDPDARMAAEKTARLLFEACTQQAWDEAGVLYPGLFAKGADDPRPRLGGLALEELGKAVRKPVEYSGYLVPYTVKLPDGSIQKGDLRVHQPAGTDTWVVAGGL